MWKSSQATSQKEEIHRISGIEWLRSGETL